MLSAYGVELEMLWDNFNLIQKWKYYSTKFIMGWLYEISTFRKFLNTVVRWFVDHRITKARQMMTTKKNFH
jgi:hypothetical protein